jgi:outer membrane beta-barrel protein
VRPLARALALFGLAGIAAPAHGQCIDETIRDELNARRRHRGVQDRDFIKAGRFEVAPIGGWYASDLFASNWLLGGTVSYFMTEEFGIELGFHYSITHIPLIDVIEAQEDRSFLGENDIPTFTYLGHLVWSPVHGKLRWFSATIVHFDLHFVLGTGITRNQLNRGLTYSGGFGMRIYLTKWLALRWDLRDHVLEQEVLSESRLVSNLVFMGGLGVWIPFGF